MNRAAQLFGNAVSRITARNISRHNISHRKFPKFLFETLEPRLLLSATPFYTAVAAQSGVDLTLRLENQGGVDTLELIDSTRGVVRSAALASIAGPVEIVGSGFDDIFRVNSDLSSLAGGVLFEAGAGEDTLTGSAADTTWNIDAADAGKVDGVSFQGVENLQGATDNKDTFVFLAGGSIDEIGRAHV